MAGTEDKAHMQHQGQHQSLGNPPRRTFVVPSAPFMVERHLRKMSRKSLPNMPDVRRPLLAFRRLSIYSPMPSMRIDIAQEKVNLTKEELDNAISFSQNVLQHTEDYFPSMDCEGRDPRVASYQASCAEEGYRVYGRIGKGAFGQVWLAAIEMDKLMDNNRLKNVVRKNGHYLCAIKSIDMFDVRNPSSAKKVLTREIIAMVSLKDHQNIVRLYQIFDTDRAAYLVMELCTGGRLREYITRHAVDVGCGLAEDEVRRLFTQLTDAVAYCHTNGMAHRDLKCRNILLDHHDNIKLIDFGLTAIKEDSSPSFIRQTQCGTLRYVPPEILRGQQYDAFLMDTWCLGVILYYMLTSHYPFEDDEIYKLLSDMDGQRINDPPGVSLGVLDLIYQILEWDATLRLSAQQILNHEWMRQTDLPLDEAERRKTERLARCVLRAKHHRASLWFSQLSGKRENIFAVALSKRLKRYTFNARGARNSVKPTDDTLTGRRLTATSGRIGTGERHGSHVTSKATRKSTLVDTVGSSIRPSMTYSISTQQGQRQGQGRQSGAGRRASVISGATEDGDNYQDSGDVAHRMLLTPRRLPSESNSMSKIPFPKDTRLQQQAGHESPASDDSTDLTRRWSHIFCCCCPRTRFRTRSRGRPNRGGLNGASERHSDEYTSTFIPEFPNIIIDEQGFVIGDDELASQHSPTAESAGTPSSVSDQQSQQTQQTPVPEQQQIQSQSLGQQQVATQQQQLEQELAPPQAQQLEKPQLAWAQQQPVVALQQLQQQPVQEQQQLLQQQQSSVTQQHQQQQHIFLTSSAGVLPPGTASGHHHPAATADSSLTTSYRHKTNIDQPNSVSRSPHSPSDQVSNVDTSQRIISQGDDTAVRPIESERHRDGDLVLVEGHGQGQIEMYNNASDERGRPPAISSSQANQIRDCGAYDLTPVIKLI